jgi:hypothetical protein
MPADLEFKANHSGIVFHKVLLCFHCVCIWYLLFTYFYYLFIILSDNVQSVFGVNTEDQSMNLMPYFTESF